jgi:hypothetical protein
VGKFNLASRELWGKYRVGYTCVKCGVGGANDYENVDKAKAFLYCHICNDGIMIPDKLLKLVRDV